MASFVGNWYDQWPQDIGLLNCRMHGEVNNKLEIDSSSLLRKFHLGTVPEVSFMDSAFRSLLNTFYSNITQQSIALNSEYEQ